MTDEGTKKEERREKRTEERKIDYMIQYDILTCEFLLIIISIYALDHI